VATFSILATAHVLCFSVRNVLIEALLYASQQMGSLMYVEVSAWSAMVHVSIAAMEPQEAS